MTGYGRHPERTRVVMTDDGTPDTGSATPEELYLWTVELPLDGTNMRFAADVMAPDSDSAAAIAGPRLAEFVKKGHYVSSFHVTRVGDDPFDRTDESWFRAHVPMVVGGYRVLEVAYFHAGDASRYGRALAITTRAGEPYSTHQIIYQDEHRKVVYQDDRRRWVLHDGTFGIETREEAEQELLQRASQWGGGEDA